MQKVLTIKLLPYEAVSDQLIKECVAKAIAVKLSSVSGFTILKSSIDARSKQTWVNLSLKAFVDEPWQPRDLIDFNFPELKQNSRKVVIVGAGPAGLFAAIYLIQNGIKPILLERGKEVRARRRDLAILNKEGKINPESNYCFGEGGAGTYSDGKLYTRSTKRGDVNRILNLFVHFGAEEKILYESHPHIGTNKLPQIITAMRKKIIDCGGEIEFEKKVVDFIIKNEKINAVKTADGLLYEGDAVILATGHSARDIFQLLNDSNIKIEFKPFSLGVRVEHPQQIIDSIQYHADYPRDPHLPPASYSLVQQVNGKGVFSFCMCPGGIIAPAATNANEIVVNGWSPSKRNNPYANSGIVVSLDEKDVQPFHKHGPLAGMYFQQTIEQKSFEAGGGKFVAPAQRLVDFMENKLSASLPACSYLPGITSTSLKQVLPTFIHKNLQLAFKEFGKKMSSVSGGKGYLTNDAVVVATESRTSSPVRIPRNTDSLEHPQISNLYPCGEGAGYAGGIVSAAMDGERVARQIGIKLNKVN